MRICYLAPTSNEKNGYGRYTMALVRGMRAEGHEVVLLTEKNDGLEGVPILRRGSGVFISALRAISYMRRCDVVHALDAYPYGVVGFLANIVTRKPFVITAIGTYAVAPLYRWKSVLLTRWAYKSADAITAICRFTRDEILKKIPSLDISIIAPGIDVKKFLQERPSQMPEDLYVLSVGFLGPRKGYQISIPAFAEARKRVPGLRYVVVAGEISGSYGDLMYSLARELGIEDVVEFRIAVSDEELMRLYSNAALFVFTAVNIGHHFNGYGIVFLEAAASGVPVIGVTGDGSEDAVNNGYNGILVPQGDVARTADAMAQILKDPEEWKRMSKNGYRWAISQDISLRLDQHILLYKKLLNL